MTGAVEDGQLTLPQLVRLSVVGIERSDTHQVGVQLQKKKVVSKRGGQSYGQVLAERLSAICITSQKQGIIDRNSLALTFQQYRTN